MSNSDGKSKYEPPKIDTAGEPEPRGPVAAGAVGVVVLAGAVWDAVVAWNYGVAVNVGAKQNVAS